VVLSSELTLTTARELQSFAPSISPSLTDTSRASPTTLFTIPVSGRGAPLCEVKFCNACYHSTDKELLIAAEGMRTGQYVYCGKKVQLNDGNVLSIGPMPEGTVVCNLQSQPGDRKLACASGNYVTVISLMRT
jgi:hypothetical protein